MLFSYTYVSHQMERMQRFVNFIFYQVWCRAAKAGPYDLSLFDSNPPLKEVMTAFAFGHTEAGDRFASQVQDIYRSFSQLSRPEIAQFKRWYQANNSLDAICANVPAVPLARYADIEVTHKSVGQKLATFYKGLYSQSLLDLTALRAKIGDIDSHYKTFMKTNKTGKCPFCGINDLMGEYHERREAYDHYLPKAIYPFNSINFKNLVPACHHCNSSYKTSKDPTYTPRDPARAVQRRAAFYPYATEPYTLHIKVALHHSDVANLTPADVDLTFGPEQLKEKIDTWTDVYGIEERYKAKLCTESDGEYWLQQVLDEWKQDGKLPADFLATLARQASRWPFAECNFLKKSFLDACDSVGLFAPELLSPLKGGVCAEVAIATGVANTSRSSSTAR